MKLKGNTFREIGRFFFNITVALFIFTLIQPLAKDVLNIKIIGIGIIFSIFALGLGIYFTNRGSEHGS